VIRQVTTDSETTEQYLTLYGADFLVFVSRDFELGMVSVQFANSFAIAITFVGGGGVPRRRLQSRMGLIFSHEYGFVQIFICITDTCTVFKVW